MNNRIELLKNLKYINKSLVKSFTLKEFKEAGYSIHDLVYLGFNKNIQECFLKNLMDAGYTLTEIVDGKIII